MQELIGRYGVHEVVEMGGGELPVIDIPMLSDSRWQQLAKENAVKNYIKAFGVDPESVEDAVKWQRNKIKDLQAAG